MTYSPEQDGQQSYLEAVRALRAAYLAERMWIWKEQRWETAGEWQNRTRPLVMERTATPEDVHVMCGAAK